MTAEGNVIHYGFIENYIDKLGKKFHIKEIAFDRALRNNIDKNSIYDRRGILFF